MDQKYPSEMADRFQIRLPDGLRDQIKADAASNGRSMNAEIISRLQDGTETLRDKFAGQALPSVIAFCGPDDRHTGEDLPAMFARRSYQVADAMLAARSKDRSEA